MPKRVLREVIFQAGKRHVERREGRARFVFAPIMNTGARAFVALAYSVTLHSGAGSIVFFQRPFSKRSLEEALQGNW